MNGEHENGPETVTTAGPVTEESVRDALRGVMDPEIPNLSIVDLGMVRSVVLGAEGVEVEIMPTFVGCPALELIQDTIRDRLDRLAPEVPLTLRVVLDEPWTTDRISEEGRRVLKRSGFAPPPTGKMPARGNLIQLMPVAECPYCGSRHTTLENPFGPTLCRAIYYCKDCRQPFEQFKQV